MEEIREMNPKEEAKQNIEKKIQKRVRNDYGFYTNI